MESFFHKSVRETIQLIEDRVDRIENTEYEGVRLHLSVGHPDTD